VGPCAGPGDGGFRCDGATGLCEAIPSVSTPIPTCRTRPDGGRPMFDDGPPLQWSDNGQLRAACVYKPAGGNRSLVVFLHGSAGSADNVYDVTSLRSKAADAGFVLVSEQGRVLPNPNGNLGTEERHDIYFRSPASNPDYRNLDRLIDSLVADGGIDPRRIFLVGWSNGAFFSQQYGIARHATPTQGGNRVAAVVAYAGGDPFQNISATQSPTCAHASVPQTSLPIMIVHRTCDSAVGCDADQQNKFSNPPGYDRTAWVARLRGPLADANVTELLVDADGIQRTACTPMLLCGQLGGFINHVRWPDGVADMGGRDWEPQMLSFLEGHPLP